MTALLASFGLLPMALSHGIRAGPRAARRRRDRRLVSATLLVLFVLPVLYVVVSRRFGDITGEDTTGRSEIRQLERPLGCVSSVMAARSAGRHGGVVLVPRRARQNA